MRAMAPQSSKSDFLNLNFHCIYARVLDNNNFNEMIYSYNLYIRMRFG